MKPIVAAILAALTLATPAEAKQHRHHRRRQQHAHASPAVAPRLTGIGNVPGCIDGADPTPFLRFYGAQILRIIVRPDRGATGSALPCVRAAAAAGYKVNLSIQWSNAWAPAQVADFYRQVLSLYAPFLWAVSIGNEQEFADNGPALTGAQYAAAWRAAEPVVASLAPSAWRVAGEISPWGLPYLKDAFAAGLPGVEAVAAHPYDMQQHFSVPDMLAWCHSIGMPVWFTEGLLLPGSWGPDLPLRAMSGATVADAWLG